MHRNDNRLSPRDDQLLFIIKPFSYLVLGSQPFLSSDHNAYASRDAQRFHLGLLSSHTEDAS